MLALVLLSSQKKVVSFSSLVGFWKCAAETQFEFVRLKGLQMRRWFGMVGFVSSIASVMMHLTADFGRRSVDFPGY